MEGEGRPRALSRTYLDEERELREALEVSRRLHESHASSTPPLISAALDLHALAAEYANGHRADCMRAKIRHLGRRYSAIKRVRGDGNCFYRAFYVSWMERLLDLTLDQQTDVWQRLVPQTSLALARELPEALGERLLEIGRGLEHRTRALCQGSSGSASTAEERLHEAANDDSADDPLLWLRLVTSAHMRAHRETFEPVCATEERTFHEFLVADVETMGVEADEMHAQALTAALRLRVRVEYLDATPMTWSARCAVHRFVVCGPSADGELALGPPPLLVACALH